MHLYVLTTNTRQSLWHVCSLDTSSAKLLLKEGHPYSQIQGEMAIGEGPWCDFNQRDKHSIQRRLLEKLPKLTAFYVNCVGPEIVSPLHPLGLPIRDLSKIN